MSIDPTKPFSEALVMQEIDRRLNQLERAARRGILGVSSAGDTTVHSQVPTTSWAAVTGAQSVTFEAPPSGAVLVLLWAYQTLEGGPGAVTVGLHPSIGTPEVGLSADAAGLPIVLGSASPRSTTATYMKPISGLSGTSTVSLWCRKSAGSVMDWHLNAHTLVVVPT